MTAVGDTVQSGPAMTNYITKNFRADLVVVHNLSEGLPPMGMWNEMQLHLNRYRAKFARHPIGKQGIMLVLSPSAEESKNWDTKDWYDFCWEFIREFDKVDEIISKGKRHKVRPTNLANSQIFAGLHRDSKSGILHLHLLGNRIDMLGNINDAHFIGERAVKAAAIVNMRRGWKDPIKIREEHIKQIVDDCMDVLEKLPEYSWLRYKSELQSRGYEVRARYGKPFCPVAYTIKLGNSVYKASELGVGRKLMASKLEQTWIQLHARHDEDKYGLFYSPPSAEEKSYTNRSQKAENNYDYPAKSKEHKPEAVPTPMPQKPAPKEEYRESITVDDRVYDVNIPKSAYDVMKGMVEVADNAAQTVDDVLRVSMLLFMNYADAATTVSESLGGGGSVESNWGRRKDDDDEWWARRCAQKANWLCKPFRRTMKR
jgi:hypothetical protein